MSTAIAKAKVTGVVSAESLEDLKSSALQIKQTIGAPSGDVISVTKNKTFRMPGTDQEAPEMLAVIVDWITWNQFYEGKYNPKEIKPPVCQAKGVKLNELVPYPEVAKRQAEACTGCPKNVFPVGGGAKECKNQRLLALMQPDNPEEGPIMLLKVSSTGIRPFDNYVNKISNATNLVAAHPIAVITRFYFDQASEYSSVRFALEGVTPDLQKFVDRRKEAHLRLLAPPDLGAAVPLNTVGK